MSHFVLITALIFIGFAPYNNKAQNLISNGGFEAHQVIDCSNSILPSLIVNDWDGLNTSDYLNDNCGYSGVYGMPFNWLGNSYPMNGKSYVGLFALYYYGGGDVREYIYQKLKTPLKKNYIYCMSYYVCRADDCIWAIKDINAWFSKNTPTLNLPTQIDTIPQVKNYGGFLIDTANWVLVSDTFIAKGGEDYVSIGNFNTDINTVKLNIPSIFNSYWKNSSYYYIDSVSLYACDSIPIPPIPPPDTTKIAVELVIPNVFTPNGDGVNDVWEFKLPTNCTLSGVEVYNRWGLEVASNPSPSGRLGGASWDGRTTSGIECSDGVYYYTLEYTNILGEQKKVNGYVSLFR